MGNDGMNIEEILSENKRLKKQLSEAQKEIESFSLYKSEQFLKSIFDHSPTAMIICEAPDGRISYINDAVWNFRGKTDAKMTGITVEEYVGTWQEFFPDGRQYRGEEMPLARSLMHGEIVKDEQLIVKLEDGTEKWAAAWSAPIYNESGKIIAAIVLFYDITEQKTMEQTLKENQNHLKSLNTTKDKLLSIIGHDLKFPFKSMLGFSQLIENNIINKKYNDLIKYSRIIQQASRKNITTLNNLIAWAQSHTNDIVFMPELLDLSNIINDTVEFMSYSALEKDIRFSLNLPSKATLFADKSMFETILRNLISNAIKYSDKGGKISISLSQRDDEYHIRISDNGIGINEERLSKILDLDNFNTTSGTFNESGTGLGLIICKEFTEKHKGRLLVESEAGKGSTFTVILPADLNQGR